MLLALPGFGTTQTAIYNDIFPQARHGSPSSASHVGSSSRASEGWAGLVKHLHIFCCQLNPPPKKNTQFFDVFFLQILFSEMLCETNASIHGTASEGFDHVNNHVTVDSAQAK